MLNGQRAGGGGDRRRPRRQGSGCARSRRHAGKEHHAGGRARAGEADQSPAGHEGGADARRRLFHPAQAALRDRAREQRRPVRVDPRRCVHQRRRQGLVGVGAVAARQDQRGRALARRSRKPRRPDRRRLAGRQGRQLAKVLLDLSAGLRRCRPATRSPSKCSRRWRKLGPTHRGYVERANFVVLRSPDVPSILVETAFISNPAEERKLRDPAHQKKLAEAVLGGVKNYFESTPPPGTWFAAQAARRNGVAAGVALCRQSRRYAAHDRRAPRRFRSRSCARRRSARGRPRRKPAQHRAAVRRQRRRAEERQPDEQRYACAPAPMLAIPAG